MSPVLMLVGVAWMYVVVMMSVAKAISANGSVLGAVVTFVLYGVLPLSIVLYLLATPARRRLRRSREAAEAEAAMPDGSAAQPDGGAHPAGDAVAPE